jgi:hypothetical protein
MGYAKRGRSAYDGRPSLPHHEVDFNDGSLSGSAGASAGMPRPSPPSQAGASFSQQHSQGQMMERRRWWDPVIQLTAEERRVPCPTCRGTGSSDEICTLCQGLGTVYGSRCWGCQGTRKKPCSTCRGTKSIPQDESPRASPRAEAGVAFSHRQIETVRPVWDTRPQDRPRGPKHRAS